MKCFHESNFYPAVLSKFFVKQEVPLVKYHITVPKVLLSTTPPWPAQTVAVLTKIDLTPFHPSKQMWRVQKSKVSRNFLNPSYLTITFSLSLSTFQLPVLLPTKSPIRAAIHHKPYSSFVCYGLFPSLRVYVKSKISSWGWPVIF